MLSGILLCMRGGYNSRMSAAFNLFRLQQAGLVCCTRGGEAIEAALERRDSGDASGDQLATHIQGGGSLREAEYGPGCPREDPAGRGQPVRQGVSNPRNWGSSKDLRSARRHLATLEDRHERCWPIEIWRCAARSQPIGARQRGRADKTLEARRASARARSRAAGDGAPGHRAWSRRLAGTL
jgi:hypothetical protein